MRGELIAGIRDVYDRTTADHNEMPLVRRHQTMRHNSVQCNTIENTVVICRGLPYFTDKLSVTAIYTDGPLGLGLVGLGYRVRDRTVGIAVWNQIIRVYK